MFFIKNGYATVWSTEDKGTFIKARISTSEKDNQEEKKYINSNWFATFVGKAKDKARSLQERDRINIISGKITNVLFGEGENKKSYLNVTIFDFEMNDQYSQNTSAKAADQPDISLDDEDDTEFPF